MKKIKFKIFAQKKLISFEIYPCSHFNGLNNEEEFEGDYIDCELILFGIHFLVSIRKKERKK